MSKLIRVENLHKHYDMAQFSVHALDGVEIYIDQGDLISLVGASGSGKTTLMNVLGGLDTPTSGSYYLKDRNITNMSEQIKKELSKSTEMILAKEVPDQISDISVDEALSLSLMLEEYNYKWNSSFNYGAILKGEIIQIGDIKLDILTPSKSDIDELGNYGKMK